MAGEQVLPRRLDLPLADTQHRTNGQGIRAFSTSLHFPKPPAGQPTPPSVGLDRHERMEVVRSADGLDDHGQRLLVGLQPSRNVGALLQRPDPLNCAVVLVPEGPYSVVVAAL